MDSLFEKIDPEEEERILRRALALALALVVLLIVPNYIKKKDNCCKDCDVEIRIAPKSLPLYRRYCTVWFARREPFYMANHFDTLNRQIGWRVRTRAHKEVFFLCRKKYNAIMHGTNPLKKELKMTIKNAAAKIRGIKLCYTMADVEAWPR